MEGFGIKDDIIEAVSCKIEVLQQEIVCSQEYSDSMTLLHEQSIKRWTTELKSLLLSQTREKIKINFGTKLQNSDCASGVPCGTGRIGKE